MPKPKRGPQRSLTPEDLRDALADTPRDIAGIFNARFAKVDARFDRMESEMRDGFQKLQAALDGTLDLFPTRKEVSVPHSTGWPAL
jgi:hypothetical protein